MHGCLFVLLIAFLAWLLLAIFIIALFWKWALVALAALLLVSTFRVVWEYRARLRR